MFTFWSASAAKTKLPSLQFISFKVSGISGYCRKPWHPIRVKWTELLATKISQAFWTAIALCKHWLSCCWLILKKLADLQVLSAARAFGARMIKLLKMPHAKIGWWSAIWFDLDFEIFGATSHVFVGHVRYQTEMYLFQKNILTIIRL